MFLMIHQFHRTFTIPLAGIGKQPVLRKVHACFKIACLSAGRLRPAISSFHDEKKRVLFYEIPGVVVFKNDPAF
jgi:hypothetical protein